MFNGTSDFFSARQNAVSAHDFLPEERTLDTLADAMQDCRGCELYKYATTAISGRGLATSKVVFVGEQPGDNEDRTGKPFVGPAGQLLDRAFAEVGIVRESIYMTGAVRHFKHEVVGKKRIHKNPNRAEISACRPWILAELKIVHPAMIVCLGVSAALSILGRQITLRDWRGRFFASQLAPHTFVTYHPAAILRTQGETAQVEAFSNFVEDLRLVSAKLAELEATATTLCVDYD